MFARSVTIRLKPNSVAEFNRTMEKEILPLLQKQKGFQDEISLVASNGSEAVGISLWNQKEDADAYNRTTYPEVQKLLAKVSEGTPQVQTFEVGSSTFFSTLGLPRRRGRRLAGAGTNWTSAFESERSIKVPDDKADHSSHAFVK